jgi:hypothetical protein
MKPPQLPAPRAARIEIAFWVVIGTLFVLQLLLILARVSGALAWKSLWR